VIRRYSSNKICKVYRKGNQHVEAAEMKSYNKSGKRYRNIVNIKGEPARVK